MASIYTIYLHIRYLHIRYIVIQFVLLYPANSLKCFKKFQYFITRCITRLLTMCNSFKFLICIECLLRSINNFSLLIPIIRFFFKLFRVFATNKSFFSVLSIYFPNICQWYTRRNTLRVLIAHTKTRIIVELKE